MHDKFQNEFCYPNLIILNHYPQIGLSTNYIPKTCQLAPDSLGVKSKHFLFAATTSTWKQFQLMKCCFMAL